jgi:GntR family transcriptional regulator
VYGASHGHTFRIMSEDPFQYVYVRVANEVEAEIRSGRLPHGARLPNERDMGALHGVAPGTARRAVQELRDRGLVVTLPNKGSFVVAPTE